MSAIGNKRAIDVDNNETDPKEPRAAKHTCTWEGCNKTFGKKSKMVYHHKAVHQGIKDVPCNVRDCTQMFSDKAKMKRHIRAVHQRIKDVPCSAPGCAQTFSTRSNMEIHVKSVHHDVRDFHCPHPECEKDFTSRQHMMTHMRSVHEGIKAAACSRCDVRFSTQSELRRHIKSVHEGIKNIPCTDPNCNKLFSTRSTMMTHVKLVHVGIKDIECAHPACTVAFSTRCSMVRHHHIVHQGVRHIKCSSPECDQVFSTKQNMLQHYQCWHTKEGQQKKIRKQDRVRQVLEEVYTVDSECHIRYEGGCVPDPDKFCARVDYHVIGITNAIVLVECDEQGHHDYTLTCELSRMEQIHEAIIKANFSNMMETEGEEYALTADIKPVVFVRFNPDAREVDGEKERLKRADREELLLEVLQDIGNGDLELPHPLNLVYIGYDMLDGEPVVCGDPDYAPQMRGCVVLAV